MSLVIVTILKVSISHIKRNFVLVAAHSIRNQYQYLFCEVDRNISLESSDRITSHIGHRPVATTSIIINFIKDNIVALRSDRSIQQHTATL